MKKLLLVSAVVCGWSASALALPVDYSCTLKDKAAGMELASGVARIGLFVQRYFIIDKTTYRLIVDNTFGTSLMYEFSQEPGKLLSFERIPLEPVTSQDPEDIEDAKRKNPLQVSWQLKAGEKELELVCNRSDDAYYELNDSPAPEAPSDDPTDELFRDDPVQDPLEGIFE